MDRNESKKSRRQMLGLLGGVGVALVVGACGSDDTSVAGATTTTGATATTGGGTATSTSTTAAGAASSTTAASSGACTTIPEETAGPYPGDGSNGPNVLTQSGVVRRDIRSSIGSASGVAQGVPLTINLTVVDSANGCKPMSGAAVYIWHCDRDGNYSMYSQGVTGENFLRGVQQADSNGVVTFTSVFPGAYSGRWPHVHFEVFPSAESATTYRNKIATSQLALPEDICKVVYATDGYSRSASNLVQTPLARDNVFSDGVTQQMATVTGNASSGYVANLTVPV